MMANWTLTYQRYLDHWKLEGRYFDDRSTCQLGAADRKKIRKIDCCDYNRPE